MKGWGNKGGTGPVRGRWSNLDEGEIRVQSLEISGIGRDDRRGQAIRQEGHVRVNDVGSLRAAEQQADLLGVAVMERRLDDAGSLQSLGEGCLLRTIPPYLCQHRRRKNKLDAMLPCQLDDRRHERVLAFDRDESP